MASFPPTVPDDLQGTYVRWRVGTARPTPSTPAPWTMAGPYAGYRGSTHASVRYDPSGRAVSIDEIVALPFEADVQAGDTLQRVETNEFYTVLSAEALVDRRRCALQRASRLNLNAPPFGNDDQQ